MKKLLIFLSILFLYGCSTSSDGNGNSTTTVVPLPPTNLTGTVAPTTQINLSWTDNSTNEIGFKIERKTGSGAYVVIGTTAANITNYNDSGLTPSTSYTYRVYSNNAVGNSLTYSNELTLTTTIQLNVSGPNLTDIDGNIYQTIINCNQTFTQSNLNVSHYRNGDIIPEVTDASQWTLLTTGAWCYYNNDSSNGLIYGKLYNWYAVNDPRGLAPVGYHIPTHTEWTTLVNCLGGFNVAGGTIREMGTTHWQSPNLSATNSSGFTGLPGGSRNDLDGTFNFIVASGFWWILSELDSARAWYSGVYYGSGSIIINPVNKSHGFSVRCIKD